MLKYSIYITHNGRAWSGPILNPDAPHVRLPEDCYLYRDFTSRLAWLRYVASYPATATGWQALRQATRQSIA